MATTLFFLPTTFKIAFAIVRAAPVFSRIVPMIVPQRITIPMLVMMEPKPELTLLITSERVNPVSGKSQPPTTPQRIAMTVMTMNGCIFSLEIASIISTTDTMMRANNKNVDMFSSYFLRDSNPSFFKYSSNIKEIIISFSKSLQSSISNTSKSLHILYQRGFLWTNISFEAFTTLWSRR